MRGKRLLAIPAGGAYRDHPRRCGENFTTCPKSTQYKGSPPQVRGKQSFVALPLLLSRITPADAGKTISLCPDRAIARDHPRGCGENVVGGLLLNLILGSPPRMRGKLKQEAHMEYINEDHPRGCGENRYISSMVGTIPGSPPRMRGKLKRG